MRAHDKLHGVSCPRAQVNKAQADEIERLGGQPASAALALEYGERAGAALAACDAALEHWDDVDDLNEDASTQYAPFDIAAWVRATNESLGLFAGAVVEPVSVSVRAWVWPARNGSADAITQAPEPNDFWSTNAFKWEDEPLVPEDRIPELWLDDGTDSDASTPRAHSFDDNATLFHEPVSPTLARRRHTLLAAAHKSHTLDLDAHSALDKLASLAEDDDDFFPLAPVSPSRTLVRTSSAPDLRLLRGRLVM